MKKQAHPNEEGLSPDRILDTTVELLRRYGPAKTSVSDVARALNVTHGSLYRYFPSKKALFDAVVEQWLQRISAPLSQIAEMEGPADQRLKDWVLGLVRAKRKKVLDDPELFNTYQQIAEQAHEVILEHVQALNGQLQRMLNDGQTQGLWQIRDTAATARLLFAATSIYHLPYHVVRQLEEDTEAAAGTLVDLLVRGLKGGVR